MRTQAELTLVVLEEGAIWPGWHVACQFDSELGDDSAPPAVIAIAQSQGEAAGHFAERVSHRLKALPAELSKQRASLAHVVLSTADIQDTAGKSRVELAKRLAQTCVAQGARFVLAAPPGCSPVAQRDLFALAGGLCEVLGSACDVSVSFGPQEPPSSETRLRVTRPDAAELVDFLEEIDLQRSSVH